MAIVLRCTNDDGVVADLQPLGNETIRLDISAIESTEIGDVFGVSSQNFTLPGTPTNQEFFGYLDNLGSTPAVGLSKTVPCQVLNDGMEVFTGKLYITDIVTNQNGDTIYNVIVVNETVDFKLAIQDLYLSDLDWSSYDHALTYANITGSWTGSGLFNEDIVYPLVEYGANSSNPQSTQIVAGGKARNFDNSDYALKVVDFKPAIRVKAIIDRIFDSVNYTYTSSFFDTADFENIYMLSTQDDKNGLTFVNPVSQSFQINKDGDSYQTLVDNSNEKIIFGNEVFDNANNVVTSRFTADVDGLYTFYTSLNYSVIGGVDSLGDILDIAFYANGTAVSGASNFVNIKGTTSGIAYLGPVSLNLTAGDYVEVFATRTYETGLGTRECRILGTVNSKFEGVGPNTVQGGTVNVGRVFDPQSKVLDFLNGLIQKFNLVVEPIKGERNVLRIEPFNDWVDLGATKDWTDKVDRSVKFSVKHPVQESERTIMFSDVEDTDAINTYTKEKFGKTYGEYTYTSESDLSVGERKVGTFFAPTPMKYIDGATNMVVPHIHQRDNGNERVSFKFKPRLLYKIGLQDNPPQLRGFNTTTGQNNFGKYYIEDEAGTVHQQSQWMLFHHLNAFPAVFNTTKDLHFGNLNQWSYHQNQFNARAKHSAYFDYWAFYINEIYDVDARLLTCNVIIEPHELPQIQLNDKIFIDGHYYRINKINGANLNREDSIEVELLKTAPRKLYYPRRRIYELAGGREPIDVNLDFDGLSPGGTGVYVGYDDLIPVTSSTIVSNASSREGYVAFGDQVVWDNVKPIQYVATQQEIQGNSTLDPSANFVKITGDDNTIKSSTQKINVVGDDNTIQEYSEYISIDGSGNTVQNEVTNVTLTNSNNTTITSGSNNITLLNALNTAVTSSDQVAILSDIGSDINNGSNTGTTTLVGTRNVTISGSTNDVTIIGTDNVAISGGNYNIVIGKDAEVTGSLDLNRYRFRTNILNGTYLDDDLYLNRDALDLVLHNGQTYAAYSGDGLYKYIYNVDFDTFASGAGSATIELPGISSQDQFGRSILFKCSKNVGASSSIFIESIAGTDNIDGSNRYILDSPYDWVELRASEHTDAAIGGNVVEWQVIRSGTGNGGGNGETAYGSFYSNVSQSIGTPGVSQSVQLGSTYESQSIYTTGSKIVFDNPGTYEFQYVAQVANSTNANQDANFWVKYNGVDYPNSNTRITLQPRKSSGEPSFQLMTSNFIGTAVSANDYIELFWNTTDAGVYLFYTGSNGEPATPSVIANAHAIEGGGPTFVTQVTQSIVISGSGGNGYFDYDTLDIDFLGVRNIDAASYWLLVEQVGVGVDPSAIAYSASAVSLSNYDAIETIGHRSFQAAPIQGSYTFPSLKSIGSNAFQIGWPQSASLTEFIAPSCSYVGISAFSAQNQLVSASIGTSTTVKLIGPGTFFNNTSLKWVYLPTLSGSNALGGSPSYDQTFENVASSGTITVPSFYSSSNGGGPDADLTYLSGTKGWTINYV